MIVLDASAMIEALVGSAGDEALLSALGGDIDAPSLLDIEVLSVLRRLALGGKLSIEDADQARADHFAFSITRHETAPLAERIWQLRHQFTSHDASYLALAERHCRCRFGPATPSSPPTATAPRSTSSNSQTDLPQGAGRTYLFAVFPICTRQTSGPSSW